MPSKLTVIARCNYSYKQCVIHNLKLLPKWECYIYNPSIHRHSLDGLENNLHRINDDLALKKHSLDLDNRCVDVRQKLQVRPQTTLDRNLSLTGMERERSKILA